MTTGERIIYYREIAGLSQKELAEKLGISNQRLNNWEKDANMPSAEYYRPLCDILNVSADDLLGLKKTVDLTINQAKLLKIYDELSKPSQDLVLRTAEDLRELESNQKVIIMPMINEGKIPTVQLDYYDQAAGMGSGQIVENPIPEKINIASSQVPAKTDFVIRVYGDSMEPTFHSNDKLFIQSTNVLEIGDIGVFNFNGEQLVKEFGKGVLISHNKEYSPIKIIGDLYIQGKVLGKL